MSRNNTRTIHDSKTEQVYIIRPQDTNSYNRLFGGILMQWMDEIAAIVARRHSGSDVVTAAVDTINFKEGANIGDLVVLIGKITYVGSSSMEVRVDVYVESREGIRSSINRAYFVLVAIDELGRPKQVPKVSIQSESDRAEWIGGEKRYALRKTRRKEGY